MMPWKAMVKDKAGWTRLLCLAAVCVMFLFLVRHGFAPRMRAVTLLAAGIVIAIAVSYELIVRCFPERAVALAVVVVAGLGVVLYGLMQWLDPAMPQWQGPLIAAAVPGPANGCSGNTSALGGHHLLMIFGQDGVVGRGEGPFTPVRIGSCPALTLTRTGAGLVVDGFGYDADNNVVYRIRRNVFEMVLRGFLAADRSDKSMLRIVDENSRAWLTVSYLNPDTVKVSGVFGCGDTKTVNVEEHSVRIGNTAASGGTCVILGEHSRGGIIYRSRAD